MLFCFTTVMNTRFLVIIMVLVLNSGFCEKDKHHKIRKYEISNNIIEYNPRPGITIPLMVHLDQTITKNLTKEFKIRKKERAKLFFKKILKNVENLFLQPHLHQKIHFVLLDVKVLRNGTKKFKMDENISKYLKSYCQWQVEKKLDKKKWYYSILFTGLDLYYLDKNHAEVRSSTGRGYMGGVCSRRNSCSLLEWHHRNIAYILAHELAHSLGISHDGPAHQCSGRRYIMNAKYNPKNPAKSWSPCNKRELKQFLLSRKSWCLRV